MNQRAPPAYGCFWQRFAKAGSGQMRPLLLRAAQVLAITCTVMEARFRPASGKESFPEEEVIWQGGL